MSLTTNLVYYDLTNEMRCWCPACGQRIEMYEEDYDENDEDVTILSNGDKEYHIYCPYCGQSFYASKSY